MTSQIHLGKIIVVTGASRGIGAQISLTLGKLGAKVVMLARDLEALKQVADEIKKSKSKGVGIPYQADLSKLSEMKQVVEKIQDEIGIPDVLINNAGAGKWTSILETSPEELMQNIVVPGISTGVMTHLFAKKMIGKGTKKTPAHIINITSPAAYMYVPGTSGGYTAGRNLVKNLTEHARIDLRNYENLKISLICPGKVATEYFKTNGESENRVPMQRFIAELKAEEVAKAVSKIIQDCKSVDVVLPLTMRGLVFAFQVSPSIMQCFLTHVFGWQPPKVEKTSSRTLFKVAAIAGIGFSCMLAYRKFSNLVNKHL